MTEQWNRRLRARIWWANAHWEDRVLAWTDRPGAFSSTLYELLTPLGWDHSQRLVCWLLRAHAPVWDQRLRPEHDFCAWCNKPMPFQGPERQTNPPRGTSGPEYLENLRARKKNGRP